MTPSRDEVLRMAREAGVSTNKRSIWPPTFKHSFDFTAEQLERFAALVAAAEREACAKLCESQADEHREFADRPRIEMAEHCAYVIRERGEA